MKNIVKYAGITIAFIIIVLYALFLIVPYFLNDFANSYSSVISKSVEKACGFRVNLENIKILTTPKLTIGAGIDHIEISMPDGETFFTADNVQGKLSLLPLFTHKIEIDMFSAENINANLKIKKDGKFLLENYIPKMQQSPSVPDNSTTGLPFDFKLSNRLPNITLSNYNLSFIDIATDKTYSVYGNNISISDFILNKKVKLAADGKVMLQDKVQFRYNVNIFNKVMPDLDLNDLLFISQEENTQKDSSAQITNLTNIFQTIHDNGLTADLNVDIKTKGSIDNIHFSGNAALSNLGLVVDGKQLPYSNVDINFYGNNIKMYSKLFTGEKELTELVANFKTGKHPDIELNCKSNAKFKSIIDMIDSVAKSFNYHEFDSLNATGTLDADFTIKSNLKTIESSGYLKISSATLIYKLYNITVNNINSDIDFANNMVNIKNAGFTILNQPLKISGTINRNAQTDLNIVADKLQLKGLLLAAGQFSILKDNIINTGTVSINTSLKGKLDKILPRVNLSLDNVNIKNIPSNMLFTLQTLKTDITSNGKFFDGKINVKNANAITPILSLSIPDSQLTFGQKALEFTNVYALYNGKRIDIKGRIEDYLTGNIKLNINAAGPGNIHLNGTISDLYKSQKLNLNIFTSKTVSIEIPGLKNSNLKTDFNIDITGTVLNPYLNGNISLPSVKIPEMLLALENMEISLEGAFIRGQAKLRKFICGNIIAENLSSDFNILNNIFNLRNITGDAFSGKVSGNISYNLANGHIGLDCKGSDLNAANAIEVVTGIKNALSGILGFNANVTLHGATDVEMIKNLKGKASFEIINGTLANIGRFENFLFAQNIQSNSIIKAAVTSVSVLPAIKNTAEFKTIEGNLIFNNGWAQLNPVTMSGPSMAYYITGRYNLLNASANLIILGRISAEVVSLLGPLGDLSVSKLTSYIPKFGVMTGNLINALTSDPKKEKISSIPPLSSGNTNYKDFKVTFNGGLESRSSMKSFKWLSTCDMSEIEKVTLKEQVKQTKSVINEVIQQKVDTYNIKKQEQKSRVQEAQQQMKDAVNGLKNLLK